MVIKSPSKSPAKPRATRSANKKPESAPAEAKKKRVAASPKKAAASPKKAAEPAKKKAIAVKKPTATATTKAKSSTGKKASSGSAAKHPRLHPKYDVMILRAIKADRHMKTSAIAIGKYIKEHYEVPENFRRFVSVGIRKCVAEDYIHRVGGSFAMSDNGREFLKKMDDKKKRTVVRKAPATKSAAETSSHKTAPKKKSSTASKKAASSSAEPKKKKAATSSGKSTKKAAATASSSSSTPATTAAAAPASGGGAAEGSTPPSNSHVPKIGSSGRPVLTKTTSVIKQAVEGGEQYIWQYYDGSWKNYDTAASKIVEDVYLKYLENRGNTDVRSVHSGQWDYMVDFMAMKQTNIQHANHTVRDIRRTKNTAFKS